MPDDAELKRLAEAAWDAFDQADFFDCEEDSEVLSASCPWDALDSFINGFGPEDDIAELFPITVYAYEHMTVSQSYLRRLAESAAERVDEDLCDSEYACPDRSIISDEGRAQLAREFATAVSRCMRDHAELWACEKVAEREYSLEEVKAEWPELFEATP